jgi:ribosomal protein S19E (S16A)
MAEEEAREERPKGVRDVPAEAFIKAYAAHLKSNDKVEGCSALIF